MEFRRTGTTHSKAFPAVSRRTVKLPDTNKQLSWLWQLVTIPTRRKIAHLSIYFLHEWTNIRQVTSGFFVKNMRYRTNWQTGNPFVREKAIEKKMNNLDSIRFDSLRGGGGVLYKVLHGETPSWGPTSYPFVYHFNRKDCTFLYIFYLKKKPFSYTFYLEKDPLSRTYHLKNIACLF